MFNLIPRISLTMIYFRTHFTELPVNIKPAGLQMIKYPCTFAATAENARGQNAKRTESHSSSTPASYLNFNLWKSARPAPTCIAKSEHAKISCRI